MEEPIEEEDPYEYCTCPGCIPFCIDCGHEWLDCKCGEQEDEK